MRTSGQVAADVATPRSRFGATVRLTSVVLRRVTEAVPVPVLCPHERAVWTRARSEPKEPDVVVATGPVALAAISTSSSQKKKEEEKKFTRGLYP